MASQSSCSAGSCRELKACFRVDGGGRRDTPLPAPGQTGAGVPVELLRLLLKDCTKRLLYLLKVARDFEEEEPQRRDALPRFVVTQRLGALGREFLKPSMSAGGALAKLVAQGEKGSARDGAIIDHT